MLSASLTVVHQYIKTSGRSVVVSGTTCSAHVFKIVVVIQSGPGAFCSFSSFKSFTIPSVEIWIGSIDLAGKLFKVGRLLQSSLVKTD